ncbi:hypothetical protein SAMN04488077_10218 [Roseovarius tolerans]|uniref:Uncharacterized protein n=1 Tax=Roseovarius tolerans TaxID=74031 RepID=A0A1H7VG01_9RHOB|nr:hypothetical protein SAMN04488077_10218 [Roseovarius tolerans]
MRCFVEQLLPSEFLLKQGVYLQTCAHIELVMWRIVQMVDGVDPSSRAQIDAYVRLKSQTRGIVKRLRTAGTKCHVNLGIRMLMLANRIEIGLANRNMAAHGAWKFHSSGQLEVEHYFTNKQKELRYVSERISSRGVNEALENADLILRDAIELHEALRSQNRPFVSFNASNEPSQRVARNNSAPTSYSDARKQVIGLARMVNHLMTSTALPLRLANVTH